MWVYLFLVSSVQADDCSIVVSRPTEALAVMSRLETDRGARALPRSSLLISEPSERCSSGSWVTVISTPWFYRVPDQEPALPGDSGCVESTELWSPEEYRFLVLASPPEERTSSERAGEILGPVSQPQSCEVDRIEFGGVDHGIASVPWLQALSVDQAEQLEGLQDDWVSRFGTAMRGRVWLSDWGTMSMPMLRYLDRPQLEMEWEREDLQTQAQRDRAIHAVGPSSYWLHFLGTDAPYSDSWARPETIEALSVLAQGWWAHCTDLRPSQRSPCVLQLGDLAWYNARRPDPLGHAEHYSGNCVDLRLFRTDGSRYEAWWNRPDDRSGRETGYSRQLTQAFVDFAHHHASVDRIYFNDPNVTGVESAPGHDDHLHLCFESDSLR